MDRETGREYEWADTARAQLVDHVREQDSPFVLRRFARWCARQTGVEDEPLHSMAGRLWAVATRNVDPEHRARVRAAATESAVIAAAVGLPRKRMGAAQLLAVHACTHDRARRAALDAAHMSERWAEFRAEGAPNTAARTARQRQVDWLLDTLAAA